MSQKTYTKQVKLDKRQDAFAGQLGRAWKQTFDVRWSHLSIVILSWGAVLSLGGHLAMSEDIFDGHGLDHGTTGI